jgi:hypothetical protein
VQGIAGLFVAALPACFGVLTSVFPGSKSVCRLSAAAGMPFAEIYSALEPNFRIR